MPVKIRCQGCEKVLNVPDKARGKKIRCPACETVVRVPGGKKKPAEARKREPQPARQAVDEDDFLGGMDLRRAVDTRVRVCVKCGAEIAKVDDDEDDVIDCPECGHNVDTGVMSETVRVKRERKGPDPDEFWGVAWSGSFAFLGKNVSLAIRTGGYWSIFVTLYLFCGFCAAFTTNDPPKYFWIGMAFMFMLGASGWFWTATVKVIQHTMSAKRNRRIEHFDFGFFENIAMGLKAVFWPTVLLLGVVAVTVISQVLAIAIDLDFDLDGMALKDMALSTAGSTPTKVVLIVVYSVSLLVFPLAMVHMSMPYSYKAWTPFHMGLCFGKNVLPALYWFVMFLAAVLPIGLTVLILELTMEFGLRGVLGDVLVAGVDLSTWIMSETGMIDEIEVSFPFDFGDDMPFWGWPILFGILGLLIAVIATPLCMIYAFPAVLLMRANGYVGLYFRHSLDLVKEQTANVPCGFWPRYLAKLIDFVIIGFALGLVALAFWGLSEGAFYIEMDYFVKILWGFFALLAVVFPWFYYATPESNPSARGSIGKKSMGIIVVDEKLETLKFGPAAGRYWVKVLLGVVTLGVSWAISAFTEKKTALHDNILQTQVLWEGDDERSQK